MRFRIVCLFGLLVVISPLSDAAFAQLSMPGIDLGGPSTRRLTPEEKEKRDKIDKAYKQRMEQIPDKAPADAWGGMRSDQPNKSSGKR